MKLKWSIKVNQVITHRFKLHEKALDIFRKFRRLFEPMEKKGLIEFYLFQMPPSFRPTSRNIMKIKSFAEQVELGEKLAIEFRHIDWFNEKWVKWISKLGLTFVSVDAPGLESKIFKSSSRIYLRLHGRTEWYSHLYTKEELDELLDKILGTIDEGEVYVFLNNNHGMLPTGKLLIDLIKERNINS